MKEKQKLRKRKGKNKMSTNNGITLVALVVTIVVLLILAGITIMYVMGDNSVFKKASDAKIETELGKIEEQAGLIYSNKLVANKGGSVSNKEVIDELNRNGNKIEIRSAGNIAVESISVEPTEISMDKSKTATITVKINESEDGNNYYALVDGKYYKATFQGSKLKIEREATTKPEGNEIETASIEVVTEGELKYDNTIVTNVQIKQSAKTIEIGSGTVFGETTLTVKYGSKTAECKVTVEDQIEVLWKAISEAAKEIANDSSIKSSTTEVNKNGILLKVGETYKVKYENSLREVRLIGFKQDDLVDKTVYGGNHKKASLTFEFMDCLGTHNMNGTSSSNSTNANGWAATEMRKWLNGYTSNEPVQNVGINGIAKTIADNMGDNKDSSGYKYIKQVKKSYIKEHNNANSIYKDNDSTKGKNYAYDYLWLLAASEIFATGYQENAHAYAITTEGDQYKYYAGKNPIWNSTNEVLEKKVNGFVDNWWLRSPYYNLSTYFCYVDSSGYGGTSSYSYSTGGVSAGFSI